MATAFGRLAGTDVVFTFAASGSLAQQIQHGAPFDLYLSANESFVRQLTDRGRLLRDSVRVYAHGRIALWSKSGRFHGIADLAGPGVTRIAIANPVHAPYGAAAQAALRNQGLWEKLEPKIVYGENVAETLQYAQSGNADAAITSWSLVRDKGGILLPAAWHPPIVQSGGVVTASTNVALGRKFLDFLAGPEGKAILRQFGVDSPD